jgi:hypothetical protein
MACVLVGAPFVARFFGTGDSELAYESSESWPGIEETVGIPSQEEMNLGFGPVFSGPFFWDMRKKCARSWRLLRVYCLGSFLFYFIKRKVR